ERFAVSFDHPRELRRSRVDFTGSDQNQAVVADIHVGAASTGQLTFLREFRQFLVVVKLARVEHEAPRIHKGKLRKRSPHRRPLSPKRGERRKRRTPTQSRRTGQIIAVQPRSGSRSSSSSGVGGGNRFSISANKPAKSEEPERPLGSSWLERSQ